MSAVKIFKSVIEVALERNNVLTQRAAIRYCREQALLFTKKARRAELNWIAAQYMQWSTWYYEWMIEVERMSTIEFYLTAHKENWTLQ